MRNMFEIKKMQKTNERNVDFSTPSDEPFYKHSLVFEICYSLAGP